MMAWRSWPAIHTDWRRREFAAVCRGLLFVAISTQRLKVRQIVRPTFVPGHDVIDFDRSSHPARSGAMATQRFSRQNVIAQSQPITRKTTLSLSLHLLFRWIGLPLRQAIHSCMRYEESEVTRVRMRHNSMQRNILFASHQARDVQ